MSSATPGVRASNIYTYPLPRFPTKYGLQRSLPRRWAPMILTTSSAPPAEPLHICRPAYPIGAPLYLETCAPNTEMTPSNTCMCLLHKFFSQVPRHKHLLNSFWNSSTEQPGVQI